MAEGTENPDGSMPLVEHFRELRSRLIKCVLAVAVTTSAAYYFSPQLFGLLKAPLVQVLGEDRPLVFIGLPEGFLTYLKVAVLAGLFAASPFLLYQIWKFVVPGLHTHESRYVVPFVILGTLFFVGGAAFGYFVIFPAGFAFFINNFQTEEIRALPSMGSYLRFSTKLLLAFGLSFELPVVVLFLARMGLVTPRFLWRNFKWAVLLMALASAFFTPADVFTMVAMLGPLTLLYLASIGAAYVFQRRKLAREEDGAKEESPDG